MFMKDYNNGEDIYIFKLKFVQIVVNKYHLANSYHLGQECPCWWQKCKGENKDLNN